MEVQKKDIDGIVFVAVKLNDYNRVAEQLKKLTKPENIQSGIVHSVHPTRVGEPAKILFYLELPNGEYRSVLHWCDMAMSVGLVTCYKYCETGSMRTVIQRMR
ncbi:hypothetical protein KSD_50150 [Ktedonobacter sp. SOSP1-85]|uniref:hypothetical protein n=1 Tax=Ktedonobacter sp. SOSP1-85 TaxID=2778367 RepID=UPI00191607E8|nr:hypothetical protein [Ktedonobacter sp. SOSP1-85]GHO77244.1 hypothetical protein KSD_50150 [Ktedonobacter sp. SOSP1-85]